MTKLKELRAAYDAAYDAAADAYDAYYAADAYSAAAWLAYREELEKQDDKT